MIYPTVKVNKTNTNCIESSSVILWKFYHCSSLLNANPKLNNNSIMVITQKIIVISSDPWNPKLTPNPSTSYVLLTRKIALILFCVACTTRRESGTMMPSTSLKAPFSGTSVWEWKIRLPQLLDAWLNLGIVRSCWSSPQPSTFHSRQRYCWLQLYHHAPHGIHITLTQRIM